MHAFINISDIRLFQIKVQTDNIAVKKEVLKLLYHHGYLSENLRHYQPAPESPAANQAAELAAIQHEISLHEIACAAV